MKKKKLKAFTLSIAYLVLISTICFWSCDKNITEEFDVIFTEVEIPARFKLPNPELKNTIDDELEIVIANVLVIMDDGKEVEGKMKFTMPPGNEEYLIKLEMTQNIFDKTELTPHFWIDADKQKDYCNKSSCYAACFEAFHDENGERKTDAEGNVISGYGWCKAECWLKAASAVIAAVIMILA